MIFRAAAVQGEMFVYKKYKVAAPYMAQNALKVEKEET